MTQRTLFQPSSSTSSYARCREGWSGNDRLTCLKNRDLAMLAAVQFALSPRSPFCRLGRRLCKPKRILQRRSAAHWSTAWRAHHKPGGMQVSQVSTQGQGQSNARCIPSSECHAARSRPTTDGGSRNPLAKCGQQPLLQSVQGASQATTVSQMMPHRASVCSCVSAAAHRHKRPAFCTD